MYCLVCRRESVKYSFICLCRDNKIKEDSSLVTLAEIVIKIKQ